MQFRHRVFPSQAAAGAGRPSARRTSGVRVLVALGCAPVLGALAVAPLAGAGTKLPIKTCGRYTGPRWTASGGSGTRYSVYAVKGAPCALALSWAPRLDHQKPHGSHALLTGPTGWACAAQLVVAHEGFCEKPSSGKIFGWGPLTHA